MLTERFVSRGTRVHLPDNAGGFDVGGCPDAEALAARIAESLNVCIHTTTENLHWLAETGSLKLLSKYVAQNRERDELVAALRKQFGIVQSALAMGGLSFAKGSPRDKVMRESRDLLAKYPQSEATNG